MSPETFASSAIILTQKNKNARKNSIKIKTFKSSPPLEILSKKYYNNMMWAWGAQQSTTKEAVMAIDNVKDYIYEYCRKYHFDIMPSEVRARYDTFAKNDDFIGNMKYWKRDLDGKPLPTLNSAKLEQLYNLFQAVFENMSQNQRKFAEKSGTKKFFNEWFGDGKVFNQPKPVPGVEARVDDFVKSVLDKDPTTTTQLKNIFKRYLSLPEDFDYDSFVSNVKAGKYKTDPKVRDVLFQMLEHAQSYSDGLYPGTWPTTLGMYDITGGGVLDPDVNKWFQTTYNASFAFAAPRILEQLVKSGSLRKDFESFDFKRTISGKINDAIAATDYTNESSDDFLPPVLNDEKNLLQRVDDKLNKFKENTINPWTNILRGTRRFFSPYARFAVEGLSGVKIKDKDGKNRPLKPTDGLKGILDNADAISKNILKKSPNGKKHFDWFAKRLKVYSDNMPKAFAGAFHNPRQMRAIVSQIIYDAINDGKIDEAKTALEIMSTMKYGIFHSNVVDALKAENFNIVGDKGLSWNKYEGVKFVTSAMDLTAKYAILGTGRAIVAIRNKWMRDNTKLKGKFAKNSKADKAHSEFIKKSEHDKSVHTTHSEITLDILARGEGESRRVITDATLSAEKTYLSTLTPGTPEYNDLLHDIQRYEYAAEEQKTVADLPDGTNQWDKDHPDKYMELMAFWDMLESFWKSHQFTFAANKMRDNFLKNGKNVNVFNEYRARHYAA